MRLLLATAALAILSPLAGEAQLANQDLVSRVGAYVGQFYRSFGSVVAEERYEQAVRRAPGSSTTSVRRGDNGPIATTLVSDFLMVQVPGEGWMPFRDVFERDGQQLRDREARLAKIFLSGSRDSLDQMRAIMNESARYNIGNIERTVNVPVFALAVLEPANQRFFRFKPARRTGPSIPLFTPPAGAFVIEYEETGQHTMIRTSGNRDIPSRGRFWIDEVSGRVLMTELIASDPHVAATIVVRYDAAPSMSLLVPVEMRERYENRRDSTRIDGAATYGTFRQFKVQVDEKLAPIK